MRKQTLSFILLILFVPIVLFVVMGCNTVKPVPKPVEEPISAKLSGTWVVTSISGSGLGIDGWFPDKKPLLSFDLAHKEVNGNTSCNPFSSKLSIDSSRITFQKPYAISTGACNSPGEKNFLDLLLSVDGYSVSQNDVLTLLAGDIAVMRLSRK
jgi:heat shock protein HslJ